MKIQEIMHKFGTNLINLILLSNSLFTEGKPHSRLTSNGERNTISVTLSHAKIKCSSSYSECYVAN